MSDFFGLGSDIFEIMVVALVLVGFGHGECCAPLISYFFTILAKRQGGPQAINSNFPLVGQNVRWLSLHDEQSYE